jgi:putative peptidoglycan lipid II flippase
MELALFLSLPAAIALFAAATPIIRGVLQHGAFTAADTLGTAAVLAAFAPGVPAYVFIKVLTPGFYARQDTKTPVRVALIAMLVNLIGNLILIWPLGPVGIALSTAISAWVNVVLLYWILHRHDHLRMDARFRAKAIRITAAGVAMGLGLWGLGDLFDPYMAGGFWTRIAALALMCGGGALVYALASFLFGAYRVSELKAQLRRPARS